MSRDLLLEKEYIEQLAKETADEYKTFYIRDRRIDAPKLNLKYVQSWIHNFVVTETPKVPSYVTAYESGRNIRKNAEAHKDNAHALCMGIKHFFTSCTSEKINTFFESMAIGKQHDALSKTDVSILTGLTTLRGSLPMGSPCSPVIANRIMLDVDYQLINCFGHSITYTRYSDDICISSHNRIDADAIVSTAREVLEAHGFELNMNKVHCMGRGDARRITGVYLTKDGVLSIGSKRKHELNESLYRFLLYGEGSSDRIRGLLDFARMVNPTYVGKLLVKYENYGIASQYGGVMGALAKSVSDNP